MSHYLHQQELFDQTVSLSDEGLDSLRVNMDLYNDSAPG